MTKLVNQTQHVIVVMTTTGESYCVPPSYGRVIHEVIGSLSGSYPGITVVIDNTSNTDSNVSDDDHVEP